MRNIIRLIEGTLTYRNIEFNKRNQVKSYYEISKYNIW